MPGIDWAYLGAIGGEGLEDFAATCLRQLYHDARQTRPASGDGGVDVYRETPAGLVVWQIKKFTAPVGPGQRRQIKQSWRRFWDANVATGKPIISYSLVTPWTPTSTALTWFENQVTSDAPFDTAWEGAAFFNMLAARFPGTHDRFFKGPDVLEGMTLAKATLASSPVESADSITMLEAINARETALREIKDMISDNYQIDSGTFRLPRGEAPTVANMRGRIRGQTRWTRIDDTRWQAETVVPTNAQSAEVEPITINMRFLVEPGSPEAEAVADWNRWGVPLEGIPAESQIVGGPFDEPEPSRGRLSFGATEAPPDLPRLFLRARPPFQDSLSPTEDVAFVVREATVGRLGGGLRIVASTRSGALTLEARVRSEEAEPSFVLRLSVEAGQNPAAVARDLTRVQALEAHGAFECVIEDGPVVAAGTDLGSPRLAATISRLAVDLARLQPHTTSKLLMPDVWQTTDRQAEELHRLAVIYDEGALTETWDKMNLTIEDPDLLRNPKLLNGEGALLSPSEPTFTLGGTDYTITRQLVVSVLSPKLADWVDRTKVTRGSEIEIVPASDNRIVWAPLAEE
ncbi:hypothetical protein [Nocardioides sp. LML1-1-1.1]|uniref:hypothetical protein n=1 Tax=Nocardioides sp. LML1-1-1.1 TaxID=3135248 RepID=UPI003444E851